MAEPDGEFAEEGERRRGLKLYTIPPHRAFADTLVAGLLRRFGNDPMTLARGLVLVPNNRSALAVRDAFVRASGGALLLPRIVSIAGDDLGEALGAALDPIEAAPLPPAIPPLQRRMVLARLVEEGRARQGRPVDAAEALRLAGELARTLDQLLLEGKTPADLAALDPGGELSSHWEASLALFRLLHDRWPAERAALGGMEAVERRLTLIERQIERWRASPPEHFVCAAGITDAAPAVARLLDVVAGVPNGLVVFAGLDLAMPRDEWDALGPHERDETTGRRPRDIEVHPQFHLKQLLHRMGAQRGEVSSFASDGETNGSGAARGRAIANALAPAAFTGRWTELGAGERRLDGITAAELPTPAAEAQAIALRLRGVLETPGRTAALVTPDRQLARRVAAHCGRWGIDVDDSAGRPLSILPPGTLLSAMVEAGAGAMAPLALLTLLKHPLVRAGAPRAAWLAGVRRLDRVLRGPRPAPGLAGIDAALADEAPREKTLRARAEAWWQAEARPLLEPIAALFGDGEMRPQALAAGLREAADALSGGEAWRGAAGRAAADLLAELEREAAHGPARVAPDGFASFLRLLMDEVAVRPAQGGHPRLAIYGLIEARLQSADVMVLGGLNEGTWPGLPAPDPWLAPRLRTELELPGLERSIGVAAHDFGQGLGAPEVLITRSRRIGGAPAIASRLWLRLEAMGGESFRRDTDLERWAQEIDAGGVPNPASKPKPSPPAALRPKAISVTEVDRLKADPYHFYARRVLRLAPLDPVDADPSAAWRGTAVHDVLEKWAREDKCAPGRLAARADAMLADAGTHPLLRALWEPRLAAGVRWIEEKMAELRVGGRELLAAEGSGTATIAGIELTGRFDRIDRDTDGGLIVIDYKTGKAPSAAAVRGGFNLQLGLLGALAEAGAFEDVGGQATGFEYWSLAKDGGGFGKVSKPSHPAGKGGAIVTDAFVRTAVQSFAEAGAKWLTGDEPFEAKLVPQYSYADYDQLMRRDEWYGRE